MNSLDLDTINALLKEGSSRTSTPKSGTASKPHERPIQIGPLHWYEKIERCASRGCGSPTPIRVNGVPRCTTHALSELNYIILQTHSDYEEVAYGLEACTCRAGKFQMMNIHTSDCDLFDRLKEYRDSSNSDS